MNKIVFAALFLVSASAKAQLPTLVQDIVPGSRGSGPHSLIVWNDKLYFYANDSLHGSEPWQYDEKGSATMLADVTPGLNSTDPLNQWGGLSVVFKNKVYFSARINGRYTLLEYDGSHPPAEAHGFSTFTSVRYLNSFVAAGNNLYFQAQPIVGAGPKIYSYNGNSAPTMLNLPEPPGGGAGMNSPIEFNGALYYSGYSSTTGGFSTLFKLDPATNSFSEWRPAGFPNGFSNCTYKLVYGSTLFFCAAGGTTNSEIFSYDGTAIKRLTNTAFGAGGPLAMFNGYLYYLASHQSGFSSAHLHRCDPTLGGDVEVDSVVELRSAMQPYKNRLYLAGRNRSVGTGWEVYTYREQVQLLSDLNAGPADGCESGFVMYNNHLYFVGDNGSTGSEIYRINDPTSIQAISWNGVVVAFPNPTSSSTTLSVTLQGRQSLELMLTDIQGRQVWSTNCYFATGRKDISIPMQGLAAGNYFYSLRDNKGRIVAHGTLTKQ